MVRGMGVAVALTLMVAAWAPARASAPRNAKSIIVTPFEGHPGSTIYLSGGGLPAHRRLAVMLSCPGRAPATGAPVTDGRGDFTAFALTVSRRPTRHALACRAAARISGAQATYRLLPAAQPLARCAITMCLRVKATIVRLRSETDGQIAIAGWPGAHAIVSIIHPNGTLVARTVTLSWNGTASLRLKVALGLRKAEQDRVSVAARLGRVKGSAGASFIVIPGGR